MWCGFFCWAALTAGRNPENFQVAAGFGLASIAFGLASQVVILQLKRHTGQLIVKRYRIFGTQIEQYPLDQVVEVVVQENFHRSAKVGQIVIINRDGQAVQVHPYDTLCGAQSSQRAAQHIRDFLQIT